MRHYPCICQSHLQARSKPIQTPICSKYFSRYNGLPQQLSASPTERVADQNKRINVFAVHACRPLPTSRSLQLSPGTPTAKYRTRRHHAHFNRANYLFERLSAAPALHPRTLHFLRRYLRVTASRWPQRMMHANNCNITAWSCCLYHCNGLIAPQRRCSHQPIAAGTFSRVHVYGQNSCIRRR